ncbi:DUF2057 domain-containing protein [Shewanella sp. YLB-09]|nr:DUF2057 domain-containing protein [Shewanella sp. YLB-09]
MLSVPAYAQITVSLPKSVDILVVNGQLSESASTLELPNGSNQILFKYNTSFRQQGQQRRFTSEAVILTFNGQDSAYELILPRLRSDSDADSFNKFAELTLIDDAGVDVKYTSDLLLKEGIQLGRDYDEEIAVYNADSSPAALTRLTTQTQEPTSNLVPAISVTAVSIEASNSTKAVTPSITDTSKEQINVGQMLDFWYSQADEETRKAFKQKIED